MHTSVSVFWLHCLCVCVCSRRRFSVPVFYKTHSHVRLHYVRLLRAQLMAADRLKVHFTQLGLWVGCRCVAGTSNLIQTNPRCFFYGRGGQRLRSCEMFFFFLSPWGMMYALLQSKKIVCMLQCVIIIIVETLFSFT